MTFRFLASGLVAALWVSGNVGLLAVVIYEVMGRSLRRPLTTPDLPHEDQLRIT
jgi:hypothetical protein